VDLRLGAMRRLSEKERDKQKRTNQQKYQKESKEWCVGMKNA